MEESWRRRTENSISPNYLLSFEEYRTVVYLKQDILCVCQLHQQLSQKLDLFGPRARTSMYRAAEQQQSLTAAGGNFYSSLSLYYVPSGFLFLLSSPFLLLQMMRCTMSSSTTTSSYAFSSSMRDASMQQLGSQQT